MQSIPRNIISLDEWIHYIDSFISPIQPGEFEITSILRARYGNLLREGIVSIRLFAEYYNVTLIVTEAGNTDKVVVDFATTLIEKQADSREFDDKSYLDGLFFKGAPCDAPERNAPWEERKAWFQKMLPSLLWLFDSNDAAKHLHIFTPHYLALLERVQTNNNYLGELIFVEERLENAVTFYENCIYTLAEPIQKKTSEQLVSMLANKMKNQEATGILNGDLKTYWDEVCIIVNQGSDNMLYEELSNEIHCDVYYAIKSLPEAEQFALWFFGEEVEGNLANYFMGDYEKDVSSIKKDFTMLATDIRDELFGMAINSLSPEAKEYLGY